MLDSPVMLFDARKCSSNDHASFNDLENYLKSIALSSRQAYIYGYGTLAGTTATR